MPGYNRSPIGSSLQTFLETFTALKNQTRQKEQQEFENQRALSRESLDRERLAQDGELRRAQFEDLAESRAARQKNAAIGAAGNLTKSLSVGQELNDTARETLDAGGLADLIKGPTLSSRNIVGKSFADFISTPNPGKGPTYTGTPEQKQDLAQDEELKRQILLADPKQRQKLETVSLLDRDKRSPALTEILRENTKPDTKPIIRIGRNGQVQNLGEAPAGSHFVNEPAPRDPIAQELALLRLAEAKKNAALPSDGMGEAALEGLSEQDKNMVKKIANYDIGATAGAMRSPQWIRWMKLASAYDPTFDQAQFNVRAGVRKDFTSGKSANNIRSLNTVIGHLDTLKNAAANLNNTNFDTLNAVKNWGAKRTGKGAPVGFDSAAHAVESEAAQLFKGMGATDQEIKAWRSTLNTNMSPEQLSTSIGTMLELMGSRMKALDETYSKGIGKPRDFSILNPKSREILKKFNVDPDVWDPVKDPTSTARIGRFEIVEKK